MPMTCLRPSQGGKCPAGRSPFLRHGQDNIAILDAKNLVLFWGPLRKEDIFDSLMLATLLWPTPLSTRGRTGGCFTLHPGCFVSCYS
jgi:hypothetical protein